MVQMLAMDSSPAGLEEISKRMPSRIADALNFPVVKEVCEVAGNDAVKRFVEFELIRLSALVNVGSNLTDLQVNFIADELIQAYQNETLADFKLCFQRAAIGQYGDIFRLDGVVIGKWMKAYLEEKYQVAESELMKEKESYKDQYLWKETEVKSDKGKDYLALWHQKIMDSKIEVREEFKEPARRGTGYKDPHPPEFYNTKDCIRRTASEFYKDRYKFDGMQIWQVDGYEVFAESQNDAEEIYLRAKIEETDLFKTYEHTPR